MEMDSQYQGAEAWISKLLPSQIVCLELDLTCLYAEVVQIVEARRLCWARPLVLVIGSSEVTDFSQSFEPRSQNPPYWHDLRQGADLLLPTILFRQAFDVEAIPVLSSLCRLDESADSTPQATLVHHQLSDFVRQLCQSYPGAFSDR